MESIKVQQYVGQDGMLHLNIPVGMTERDVEVLVIYQAVPAASTAGTLEKFYGICADDPIVLDDHGILESLDHDLAGAFD